MIDFCDLPHAIRLHWRAVIERAGGHVAGYRGAHVQVAIPHPAPSFLDDMEEAGLVLDENSLHHFPLGTDCPAESLTHPGGHWLFGLFSPEP